MMKILFDGQISPGAFRRGFMRHYQPSRGETLVRLGMMLVVAVGLAYWVSLGHNDRAVWGVGLMLVLLPALPWLWPALLAGAAWRAKLRSGTHERGVVTQQALIYDQGGVEHNLPLNRFYQVRVYDDMMLLYHTPQAYSILAKALLTDQAQWPQLVRWVRARVPDYASRPRKKNWLLAVAYLGIVAMLALVLWQMWLP